jgi:hypothetical protein
MSTVVIDNPTLNRPFAEVARRWILDRSGVLIDGPIEGGRRGECVVPDCGPGYSLRVWKLRHCNEWM